MKSKAGLCGSRQRPKARTKVEQAAADTAVSLSKRAAIIGREKEIEIIREYIRLRKSLHLHGAEGVGKSALLDSLYRTWNEIGVSPIPVYCRNSVTLREILVTIAGFLLGRHKLLISFDNFKRRKKILQPVDVKKLSIRHLRNMVFPCIKKGDFCIILDHLDHITPGINALVSALHERACVITASRQSWVIGDYSFTGRLEYCLYLVPKLGIENLDKKDAFILMQQLYNDFGMKLPDKVRVFNDIFHISEGNPKMIKDILDKARKPDYIVDGKLNLNLIVIDCRIDAVRIS